MPALFARAPATLPHPVAYTATFITVAALIIAAWVTIAVVMFWWKPRRNAALRRAEDQRLGFHLTIRPASDESWGNNNNIHIIELSTISHAPEPALTEV